MSNHKSDPMVALSEYLHQYVDRYRQEHGRGSLAEDSAVHSVAMEHSANQARRGTMMERTMKGEPVAAQITQYGTAVDLEAKVDGQNETPESIAREIVGRWVNDSASQRALLDPIYEYASFGAGTGDLSVYATAILCSDLSWLQRKKRRVTSM
jgi:uncharacterized protein YkwD